MGSLWRIFFGILRWMISFRGCFDFGVFKGNVESRVVIYV